MSIGNILKSHGIEPAPTRRRQPCGLHHQSERGPNLNAHLERFFGTLKSECLHKQLLFGEIATRKAIRAFLVPYHTERNHQGLDNELIVPMVRPLDMDAEIKTTECPSGLLRSYRHAD